MSSKSNAAAQPPGRMELHPFLNKLPAVLIAIGVLGGAIGLFTNRTQFAYSYLLAFMFFLSIGLGGLFLTLIHHLFDASWSVPVRRINEHFGFLLPVMAVLFIPIALLAPVIYKWMSLDPLVNHALHAKQPLLTKGGFYLVAVLVFAIWSWLTYRLRHWSLEQDKTGAAKCTFAMRRHSAYGIYLFAFTLTLASILWMQGVQFQWFSTMYGVYYFAGSVWVTLATLYLVTVILVRTGPLDGVIHRRQMHDIGVLFFTFTVFYAYIAFSQYFIIWNANIPEETYFFTMREEGSWWQISLLLVFGHFFIPFLALLRIDAKLSLPLMIPLVGWAWAMHFIDMSFNIVPELHPAGFHLSWLDFTCLAFIGGVLATMFLKYFRAHAPYPIKDPRLAEGLGVHHVGARPPIAAPQ